jgi:hypothetical protein
MQQRAAQMKMRDALAPRISGRSSLFVGALQRAPDDRYRRFAFLARFFAALRGAFFAVFLPPFDFLAAFLADFFAFLAMPWLLRSYGNAAAVLLQYDMCKHIRH